jgi:hypothetical protein
MTRKVEGVAVAGIAVVTIAGILACAVAWGPKHECVAQFPKIIGCALGTYEGLAGGLIAAGGAAFAGWLAWSAARDQIVLAKRQAADTALAIAKARLENEEFELSRLRTAKATMLSLRQRFDPEREHGFRSELLARMWKRQEFLTSSADLTTNSMGGRLWEAANRLRLVAQQIDNSLSNISGDQRPSIIKILEPDAIAAIENFNAALDEIDGFITRQQNLIDLVRRASL